MQTRQLGKTGFSVSEIGFGAWAIGGSWGAQDESESVKALHAALDRGVTFIDTAAGYGNGRSERIIGKVLKERGKSRERIVVATKTPPLPGPWPPTPYCKVEDRFPEKYIRESVEQRLTNLGTDSIDVLQLHTWTRAWNRNPEPLLVLQKLKKEGKVRSFGISTPEQDQNCVVELMRNGLIDTVQVIYNIFEQDPAAELLPAAQEHGIGIIVRVAFDEGSLTGKFTKDTKFEEDDFRNRYFAGDRLERTIERVKKIEEDIFGSGLTMPQVALKFVLDHPAVSSVIPGIRTVRQAELNSAVSDLPDLTPQLVQKLHTHLWLRSHWYSGK
ncbi:MAG TPA: aldo/keto reductase [Spirochaetia bacterium]|nr:aldo/keto reductase [Spirochaetia bacterium]